MSRQLLPTIKNVASVYPNFHDRFVFMPLQHEVLALDEIFKEVFGILLMYYIIKEPT